MLPAWRKGPLFYEKSVFHLWDISTLCSLHQLVKVNCVIPHEECRRGAHLPSLGCEPVGGKSTEICDAPPIFHFFLQKKHPHFPFFTKKHPPFHFLPTGLRYQSIAARPVPSTQQQPHRSSACSSECGQCHFIS